MAHACKAPLIVAIGMLVWLPLDGSAALVTITIAKPIEKLEADGHPSSVSTARVGAVYSLVKQDGPNLILQDDAGGQYLIALLATDYTPPPAPAIAPPPPAPPQVIPAPSPAPPSPVASATTNVSSSNGPLPAIGKDDQEKMTAINAALGLPLFVDTRFWQNDVGQVAARLHWPMESKTTTEESYRLYPTHGRPISVLGAKANSLALYGKDGKPTYISIVFTNAGDFAAAAALGSRFTDESAVEKVKDDLAAAVKKDAASVTGILTPLLGESSVTLFGNSASNRDEVHRWDWKDVSILLNAHDGEYASIKIIPADVADNHGTVEVTERDQMRDLLAKRVVKRPNGDVIISELPMVNQGPKGYCVPATWERYLRYMDVPADLYVLAIMGNTGFGGGTSTSSMQAGVDDYVSAYHRRIETYDAPLDVFHVARYIDQGLPLMWTCWVVEPVEIQINKETRERKTVTDWPKFADSLRAADAALGDFTAPDAAHDNGHERMIIGYNATTKEIAISDSWGERFSERWMYVPTANKITQGQLNYLSW